MSTSTPVVVTGLVVEFNLKGKKALIKNMLGEEYFTIGEKDMPKEVNLVIDAKTGHPTPSLAKENKVLHLSSPVQYMGLLKDDEQGLALTIVGTKTYTYFHFIAKAAVWVIKTPATSASLNEAAWKLFLTNLYHGEESFNRMGNNYPHFFEALFKVAFEAPTTLAMAFPGPGGVSVPAKLYLYPQKPKDNILSIGGLCMDIDLDKFPGTQIDRGVTTYIDQQAKDARKSKRDEESRLKDFLSGVGHAVTSLTRKPVQKKRVAAK